MRPRGQILHVPLPRGNYFGARGARSVCARPGPGPGESRPGNPVVAWYGALESGSMHSADCLVSGGTLLVAHQAADSKVKVSIKTTVSLVLPVYGGEVRLCAALPNLGRFQPPYAPIHNGAACSVSCPVASAYVWERPPRPPPACRGSDVDEKRCSARKSELPRGRHPSWACLAESPIRRKSAAVADWCTNQLPQRCSPRGMSRASRAAIGCY